MYDTSVQLCYGLSSSQFSEPEARYLCEYEFNATLADGGPNQAIDTLTKLVNMNSIGEGYKSSVWIALNCKPIFLKLMTIIWLVKFSNNYQIGPTAVD